MNYPTKIDDYKKFEKINRAIAFNIVNIEEKEYLSSLYFKN